VTTDPKAVKASSARVNAAAGTRARYAPPTMRRRLFPPRIGLVSLAGIACLACAASPKTRAKPPGTTWPKSVADTFFPDAFTTLEGQRPDFRAPGVAVPAAPGRNAPGATAAPGGFKWSTLVSEDTLTDEIKDMKAVIGQAIASPSTFKGGGYKQARVSFSTVALSFGVIAAYDTDIRWKKQAEQARDLFARVAANCKVGTDQSLAEAKIRMADLEMLLDGNPIEAKADRDEDFLWSQVAGRPPLMARLETAEQTAAATIASKGDFEKQRDALIRAAEMMAMIGEVIQQRDYEHHDDETYRGHASQMRDAGVKAAAAARSKDYEAARAAIGTLQKACTECHGGYRG
jgi:hypothetical protein